MSLIMSETSAVNIPAERSLLIVEDDKSFGVRLARAMESRGFEVTTAESVAVAETHVDDRERGRDLLDLQQAIGNGLGCGHFEATAFHRTRETHTE